MLDKKLSIRHTLSLNSLFPSEPSDANQAPAEKAERPQVEHDSPDEPVRERLRICGGCGSDFLSTPSWGGYVPLHCTPCDEENGERLRALDPLYGRVHDWTPVYDKIGVLQAIRPGLTHTQAYMSALAIRRDPGARKHARYSPSTYSSREKCPGWTPDNDPSKSTTAADRGTLIHDAIEKDDTSALVAEEDILCADKCIQFTEKLTEGLAGYQRFKELQVRVLDQFGTVDDLIVVGKIAHLTDYKTGYREVPDAEINAQVQGYILGVFDQFEQVEQITARLLMPRQNEISIHTYTRAEHYKALKHRTFITIESSKATDRLFQEGADEKLLTVLQPSAENCEYCGRKDKGQCPALNQLALTIVRRYQPELLIPEELHGSQITDPSNMARALLIAPIMEEWAKGVKKAGLAMRMDAGTEIPGFTLAERKGARKITNAQAAWDTVKNIISPDEFAGCADVSMPDLEKAVAAKAPRGEKEAAKQQLENQLRDRSALKDANTVHFLKQVRA